MHTFPQCRKRYANITYAGVGMKRIHNRKHLSVLLPLGLYSRVKLAALRQGNEDFELISVSEMIRRALDHSFPKGEEEAYSFPSNTTCAVLLRKHVSLILESELYNRVKKAALCQSSREGDIVTISQMIRRSLQESFPDNQTNIFDLPVKRGNRSSRASMATA